MKFREFAAGQVFHLGPDSVSAEEIVAFAEGYDPQWFHNDPARAAAGPWRGLIASGWQTCGIAMRLVAREILEDSESFGSPGLDYLKWPNPVRPGEPLRLRVDVLEARVAQSRPDLGILRWRWRLQNEPGQDVLDLVATSLFDLAHKPA